jgi:hypothetical protein
MGQFKSSDASRTNSRDFSYRIQQSVPIPLSTSPVAPLNVAKGDEEDIVAMFNINYLIFKREIETQKLITRKLLNLPIVMQ